MTGKEFVMDSGVGQLCALHAMIHQAAAKIGLVEVEFILLVEPTQFDKSRPPEGTVRSLKIWKCVGEWIAPQGIERGGQVHCGVAQSIASRIQILIIVT